MANVNRLLQARQRRMDATLRIQQRRRRPIADSTQDSAPHSVFPRCLAALCRHVIIITRITRVLTELVNAWLGVVEWLQSATGETRIR